MNSSPGALTLFALDKIQRRCKSWPCCSGASSAKNGRTTADGGLVQRSGRDGETENADAIGDLRLAPVFRHDLALARPATLASPAAAE